DTPFIRAYARIWADPIHDDDPRRPVIAAEMRQLRAAAGLQEALAVIGWWYSDGRLSDADRDAEVRSAMRRLKSSKTLG
ncbi:hypothetical protein VDF54_18115, partial [Xanthomonas campestris pv. raphani]